MCKNSDMSSIVTEVLANAGRWMNKNQEHVHNSHSAVCENNHDNDKKITEIVVEAPQWFY